MQTTISTSSEMDSATRIAKTYGLEASDASHILASADTQKKNAVLYRVASLLRRADIQERLLEANQQDLLGATHLSLPLRERLQLSVTHCEVMAQSVERIALLPDPVGSIEDLTMQPSGLSVGRMSVPLGVVLFIYESRPNVTIEAAALCLKSGNACILRGGKEALQSNSILASLWHQALAENGLPPTAIQSVLMPDKNILHALLRLNTYIQLTIPRGGTALIDTVRSLATMPVIEHYQGICHLFVDRYAHLDMAVKLTLNGKVSKPGVCNALECLIVDAHIASEFLTLLIPKLHHHGVEIRGCIQTCILVPSVTLATEADFHTEFLDKILAIRIVNHFEEALQFIAQTGTHHTEAIVTEHHSHAMEFLRRVDASCVLVNASTRFNDGGELGLGAELGISTTKFHAYGPMGLQELCTRKFIVLGNGHTRGQP